MQYWRVWASKEYIQNLENQVNLRMFIFKRFYHTSNCRNKSSSNQWVLREADDQCSVTWYNGETEGDKWARSNYYRYTSRNQSRIGKKDRDWHNWNFGKFVEQLRQWTERNLISFEKKPPEHQKRERAYKARQSNTKLKNCVYCNKADHKSTNCNSVTSINKRRKVLSNKKFCFNCTGTRHRANECKSENTCRTCKRKYHTSICEKTQDLVLNKNERNTSVTYPVVIISVDGNKSRALLDTGAKSSYIPSTIVSKLKKNLWEEIQRK